MATALTVGILLATQFKSQADFQRNDLPSRRIEDLLIILKKVEKERDDLGREVAELRQNHTGRAANQDQASAAESAALDGPGVEVTINDSAKPVTKGEDPNIAIVHNDDLLRLVNELRAAGAEAVAVNDQRMADTSEIACAGTTILINKTRIAPPFTIRAIGEPATLQTALQMRGGIVEYLQFYGIQVTIARKSKVQIPSFSGSAIYKYAKPVAAKVVS